MGAAYGHRWTSGCGDLPIDDDGRLTAAGVIWSQALAGFADEVILRTVGQAVISGGAWPPNLAEFRQLCVGSGSDPNSTPSGVQMGRYGPAVIHSEFCCCGQCGIRGREGM